jgi:hypothetical protein
MKAIPTDVYDKEGNLTEIEFHNPDGDFIIVAHWDHTDKQTSPNREKFRKWAYRMVGQLDYEVDQ